MAALPDGLLNKVGQGNYFEAVDVYHFVGNGKLVHVLHYKKYFVQAFNFMLQCCRIVCEFF